jgi:outer membrane scaffolding protein for murein synthesis (MipA/OmpV family)
MPGKLLKAAPPFRRIGALVVLFCAAAAPAHSQTPSPLQEWQYSSGIILERLFEPQVPEWRVVAGVGDEIKPLYDGARIYKAQAGPVFNIRYYDYAFASVGEGFGVNILRGDHYRVGIALGYDLGRYVSDDPVHLHGMGDIRRSPVIKVFESVAVSKKFPLVLRADVRQYVGGADGAAADLEAYMPLPGSSKKFVMFAGPSITFADHLFLQKEFGVSASQSLASGYPGFDTHAGTNSVGFGFSATRFISKRWLINLDAAVNHLRGSADTSPISQRGGQRVLALSVAWNE